MSNLGDHFGRARANGLKVGDAAMEALLLDQVDRKRALEDRMARAAAVLASAPDIIGDEASKRLARDVAAANREAWAILTEHVTPPSRRQAQEAQDVTNT